MKRKNYLSYEEYVDLAPEEPGQVNVDHDSCSAGTDRKKRLYIRRLDDGHSILAYCHNCGLSGYYNAATKKSRHYKDRNAGDSGQPTKHSKVGKSSPRLPSDLDTEPRNWPARARAWCYKYGLTDEDIKRGKFGYSNTTRRVHIPVYGPDGPLVVQSRRIHEDDKYPKYLTFGDSSSVVTIIKSTNPASDRTLVIVEDMISGLKVSKVHDVLVLLGSELSDRQALVCSTYKKVFIFLDNDNPIINKKALTMQQKLGMIVDIVVVTHTNKDPKEYTIKELEEILK